MCVVSSFRGDICHSQLMSNLVNELETIVNIGGRLPLRHFKAPKLCFHTEMVFFFGCSYCMFAPKMNLNLRVHDSVPLVLLMEEILHHLTCLKPCKSWEIYHVNPCKISAINSIIT